MTNLVWLRRNLRLDDNLVLYKALKSSEKIQCIFILDTDILKRFTNPLDRRVKFIKKALYNIHSELKRLGGGLIVMEGRPQEIIPKVAKNLGASKVFADEDFEPDNIKRDIEVGNALKGLAELELYCDHLIFQPKDILKSDGKPYKVYTPYMKAFRERLSSNDYMKYDSLSLLRSKLAQNSYEIDNVFNSSDDLWDVEKIKAICDSFISNKIADYSNDRNYLSIDGTSQISPYIRFGIVSIRELFREAFKEDKSFSWVNELIWREFYAYILYHFPKIVSLEFNEKYRNIVWSRDETLYNKITSAQTGYPIIDAAIMQLLQTGWMHNRARMIVASFWTKNLFLDWRLGEEFFAQHLMDYDLASNVGGWQWAASCGVDAQPYFRVFNPMLQAEKFDPDGKYVRQYLPCLSNALNVHDLASLSKYDYVFPMVDYKITRAKAIDALKNNIII